MPCVCNGARWILQVRERIDKLSNITLRSMSKERAQRRYGGGGDLTSFQLSPPPMCMSYRVPKY